jgi:hypothetical protein
MAKKRISDRELMIMKLDLEKVKFEREKADIALNKSLFLYFIILFIAVVGFVNGMANLMMLNILILTGIAVLIIGSIPYLRYTIKQRDMLDNFISTLKNG